MQDQLATLLRTTAKNLPARIAGMKLGPVCGRCGGSGRHSFNQMDGDTCWGCKGAGHVLPSKPAEWKATADRAAEAVSSGLLDAYLAELDARRRCKNGMKRAFAAWTKMDALNGYGKNWMDVDKMPNSAQVIERNQVGVDLVKKLQEIEYAGMKTRKTDWVEYDRVLTEGLATLEAITKELEAGK